MLNRGPPVAKSKIVREESLSEPQLIKQTYLSCFFMACRQLAEMNRLARLNKRSHKIEANFLRLVQELFLGLSMKDMLREKEGYQAVLDKIHKGEDMDRAELCYWLTIIGDILQELGPLKIELLKSVAPNYAYLEDRLLGDD